MIAGRQNELKGVRRFGSAPGSRDPAPKSLRGIGTRGATFGLRLWETRANRGPASLGGPSITFFSFLSQNFSPAPHCGAGPDLWKARPLVPSQSTLQPPPTALEPGRARKSRPRTPVSLFIGGGRRLRRAQRGGAAFEVAAAAAFILSFFPLRPLCVTKFGKNMDPSQSFHVCSQLPAEKAKGSLPGKETGRKIKEFGELDLKCELKIKIKPGHIPVSKAKPNPLQRPSHYGALSLSSFHPPIPP